MRPRRDVSPSADGAAMVAEHEDLSGPARGSSRVTVFSLEVQPIRPVVASQMACTCSIAACGVTEGVLLALRLHS